MPEVDNSINPAFAKLELSGINVPFDQISGFSISCEVEGTVTAASEAGMPTSSYRCGPAQYGDLSCSAPLDTDDTSLFEWWQELTDGVIAPKDGTLIISDPVGAPQITFNVVGAVMTSLGTESGSLDSPSAPRVTATFNCLSYSLL